MKYSENFLRGRALTAIIAATLAVPTAQVAAQNTLIDFNTLTETIPGSGTRFVNNCYMENGFVLTAVGLPCTGPSSTNAFVANGPNSPLFGGGNSPALVLNTPNASQIDLMRSNGGVFALNSIALSGFFGASMTNVLFSGFFTGGSVQQSFLVGLGMQSYTLRSDFMNLTSVRITALNEFDEPLVNFDDIRLTVLPTAVVPEPATFVLMFSGLAALLVVVRRRRTI